MKIYNVSLLLLIIWSTSNAADEYIPDSRFEKINITLDDNLFSKHVSIKTISEVQPQQGNLEYSPKKYYAFTNNETYAENIGFSSIITISSLAPGKNTLLTISDHKSNGVQLSWINDKYLMCNVWIGRISCVQFIFDCDKRAVVTCDLEYYDGEIHKQQKAQYDAETKTKE